MSCRIKPKALVLAYKTLHDSQPSWLSDRIPHHTLPHSLCSSDFDVFTVVWKCKHAHASEPFHLLFPLPERLFHQISAPPAGGHCLSPNIEMEQSMALIIRQLFIYLFIVCLLESWSLLHYFLLQKDMAITCIVHCCVPNSWKTVWHEVLNKCFECIGKGINTVIWKGKYFFLFLSMKSTVLRKIK